MKDLGKCKKCGGNYYVLGIFTDPSTNRYYKISCINCGKISNEWKTEDEIHEFLSGKLGECKKCNNPVEIIRNIDDKRIINWFVSCQNCGKLTDNWYNRQELIEMWTARQSLEVVCG